MSRRITVTRVLGLLGMALMAIAWWGCALKSASPREGGSSATVVPGSPHVVTGSFATQDEARTEVSRIVREQFQRSLSQGQGVLRAQALPGEELWVIARADDQPPTTDDTVPGAGALMAKTPADRDPVPVPLKHTDVKADIAGYIATVDVTQQYHNPYNEKIEAVYVFPLPANAAVSEFVMTIGDRHIRGLVRERQEAQRIYQEAKTQGYRAALLTQERPNVFTQSVANIEPGKEIDIHIRYFHTLAYVDGYYEWDFPMVVGPRFNPPGSTDGIGAAGRGASGQTKEVQYLKPTDRSGHDIALSVNVDAGVKIESVQSINHRTQLKQESPTAAEVTLAADDRIPNKDFVLRYRVAGQTLKSALMTDRDKGGGYFTLMLYPPKDLTDLPRKPLELVFTLDVSGSMSGAPIEQAKSAVRYALKHLRPDDTFQIIRFANGATRMGAVPIPATPENVARGLRFIESTEAGGGTMMMEGIRESLQFPHDDSRLRFVTFLTDGYIGNERQILAEVQRSLAESRIFSFGVGNAPNCYLLDHLAKMGNGAVAYLSLNEKGEDVMDLFFNRIAHPAMTDVQVSFGNLQVADVYPRRVPDLFVGRPVIITGRFAGHGKTAVTVRGKVGSQEQTITIPVDLDDASVRHPALASVWARMKISELDDRIAYEDDPGLPRQIKQVALEYGLMSAYTAFLAVDASERTAGEHGTSVAVPVPVPEGVRYDTTVKE